ncbi:LamG-like jellyroll fold domain-containing protein [Streptomyces sp. NPDC046866]|uniref:LamG-like jellyroll fold domain-containing protein n=1 Tax=Streptomyces sp. NPDC046866 TaxID=3154921 RepID=UPI00345417C3
MTDGKNPPTSPQPEPAPGNGGYGFPPVPPAPGGYGYPGPPTPGGAFGPAPTAPAPGAPGAPAPGAPAAAAGQPGYGYPQPGQPNPYQQGTPAPGTPAAPGAPAPAAPPSPGAPGGAPGTPGGTPPAPPAPFQQNPNVPPAQWPPAGLPVQDTPMQAGPPGAPAAPGAPGGPGGPGLPGNQPPGAFLPPPLPLVSDQPDWEAMADRSAAERRKKKLWMIAGGVTVLALLAGGGTFFLLGDGGKNEAANNKPSTPPSSPAPVSPSPSGSKSKAPVDNTPTVKDDPTQIRDRAGKAPLKMGADAGVFPIDKRFEIRTKGSENSYAESEKRVVDTSKSFTVSARVWNRSPKGRQIAVSQGSEKSFSFELGLDQVNGKPAWIFRVQTGDQGAESTTQVVSGESPKMEKTFAELTATYDAERKLIALYVNGKKAGETAVSGVYQAQGPLQLARSRHEDKWTSAWNGAMDTIHTYDVALSPAQIDALKSGKVDPSTKPTGAWLLF